MIKSIISRLGKRWIIVIVSTLAGVIGGLLYFSFYGCTTGCAINSNPYLTMIWGGLIGYLFSDFLVMDKFKNKE